MHKNLHVWSTPVQMWIDVLLTYRRGDLKINTNQYRRLLTLRQGPLLSKKKKKERCVPGFSNSKSRRHRGSWTDVYRLHHLGVENRGKNTESNIFQFSRGSMHSVFKTVDHTSLTTARWDSCGRKFWNHPQVIESRPINKSLRHRRKERIGCTWTDVREPELQYI